MENFNPENPIYDELGQQESTNINEVFQNLEYGATQLLEKIREKILHNEYGAVLGIDSSGRVPALLMSETINKVYEHNKQPHIPLFFIAGFRQSQDIQNKYQELLDFLDTDELRTQHQNGKKILIVDDVITTGRSVAPIVEAMQKKGYIFEVGALSVDDTDHQGGFNNISHHIKKTLEKVENSIAAPITYGSFGTIPDVYGKPQMSGVHKDLSSIHAKPLRVPVQSVRDGIKIPDTEGVLRTPEPISHEQNYSVLKYTRKKIHELSNKLAKQVVSVQT